MTSVENAESRFVAALADFENCMETPIVPGELPAWLEVARETCSTVGDLFRREMKETHHQLLQHITREDIALAARVEALQENDRELMRQWNDLQAKLDRLYLRAERVEPHEGKLDKQIEQLTSEALAFVIAARKQEKALTTWYMEALNRDRGVAD